MARLCGGCVPGKRTAMVAPGGWSSSTAVSEEYPMWVMPVSEFIELDRLQPHQMLRVSDKIVQFDKSMLTVFFLSHQCVVSCPCCMSCRIVCFCTTHTRTPPTSHSSTPIPRRWTGFNHPDQTLEQLRMMQRLFLRMMAGDVKDTEPDFESRVYLPKAHKITSRQWSALVPEAYIWMVRAQALSRCVWIEHDHAAPRVRCHVALIRTTFRSRNSASTSKATRQTSSRP